MFKETLHFLTLLLAAFWKRCKDAVHKDQKAFSTTITCISSYLIEFMAQNLRNMITITMIITLLNNISVAHTIAEAYCIVITKPAKKLACM